MLELALGKSKVYTMKKFNNDHHRPIVAKTTHCVCKLGQRRLRVSPIELNNCITMAMSNKSLSSNRHCLSYMECSYLCIPRSLQARQAML